MYNYYEEPYLSHYGVLGMKWGVRKDERAAKKSRVNKARDNYRKASNNFSTSDYIYRQGVRTHASNSENKKNLENRNKAYVNRVNAEANYKKVKSRRADKAEYNTYKKAFQNEGMPTSILDMASGGSQTALYKNLSTKKGKSYADSVLKDTNKAINRTLLVSLAGTTAFTAGALFLASYM